MTPHAKNDAAIIAALAVPGWFEKRVTPRLRRTATGCLIWDGSLSHGYAQVGLPAACGTKTAVRVSRVIWHESGRTIPADYVLDHDGPRGCSDKACVEPAHLQAVTIAHNIAVTGNGFGATNARKATCPQGHPLTEGNLMPTMAARGHRMCLSCSHESNRRRNEAVRSAAAYLDLPIREYVREYGWSERTAGAVLERRRAA
ncbi:MAG: hypothetical protein ACOH10_08085 [Rhodoglobus sp.]